MRSLMGWFGLAFCIVALATMAVSYLRRRGDLLSTWHLFLLGSVNFVGIAAMQSARDHYIRTNVATYHDFSDVVYLKFVLGGILFFVTAYAVYYGSRWTRQLAASRLQEWPEFNTGTIATIGVLCAAAALVLVFLARFDVPIVKELAKNCATPLGVATVVLAFTVWRSARSNPIVIALALGIAGLGLVIVLRGGIGRRVLLSALIGLGVVAYWMQLRYYSRLRVLIGVAVPIVIAVLMLNAYQGFRHATAGQEGSGLARGLQRLKMLGQSIATPGRSETDIGSDAVDISLLTINMFSVQKELPQRPFYTVTWVLINPIPRTIWPDKPEALGFFMPQQTGQLKYGPVNWGPGLIGHGFHEGGYLMIMFYAALFATFFRCVDEFLLRQPNNPYLLTIVSVISGQIVGLARGDQAVFMIEMVGGIISCLVIFRLWRLVTGRTISYQAVPVATG